MENKLNVVFRILNEAKTVAGNRYLSHALGTEVAVIYCSLLAKYGTS